MSLFLWCAQHSLAFMFNRKTIFPVVDETTKWKTLLILHERMGFFFKVQLLKVSALYSSGMLYKFSGTSKEEAFTWSLFMQIHFHWMQPSRDTISSWLHHQHLGFFTKELSHKPIGHASKSRCLSLLKATILFLCSKGGLLQWHYIQLNSTSTYLLNSVCYLGVCKSQLSSYLLVRDGRN